MAQLTDEQLELAGEAFAMLRRVLQRNNLEDLQEANVYPLKVIKEYHDATFATRTLGNAEEGLMSRFYDCFTLKEWHENYDAPLTTEQQGIFNVAYAEARSHGWKPKQKKSKWR